MSRSLRSAWIEITLGRISSPKSRSRSLRSAWIEIISAARVQEK